MSENNSGVAGLQKQNVGLLGVIFMIFALVAAGGFGAEEMIPECGPGMTILLLLILPFVWAMPISNACSELGAILPDEGGVYVWIKEAFGEFWGFLVGWWNTIGFYASSSIYIVLATNYLAHIIPMNETAQFIFKCSLVLLFMVINLMGIGEVSKVNSAITILILIAFAAVAIVGITNWQCNPLEPMLADSEDFFGNLTGGFSIAIWMYCGYECIGTISGELKNPQLIPKALVICLPIVALVYILPLIGGLASLGPDTWDLWTTGIVSEDSIAFSTVLETYIGPIGGALFVLVAGLSQIGQYNMYVATGSRGFFVLADDNLFPKFMCRTSKKKGVPHVSIIVMTALVFLLMNLDFQALVMIDVVTMIGMYFLICLSLIVLRKKYPLAERKEKGLFIIPGGNAGLWFSVVLPIFLGFLCLIVNGADYLLCGLAALVSGAVFYIIFKLIYGGLSKTDPDRYVINPKTKLDVNDTLRLAIFFLVSGLTAFFGQMAVVWYEGEEAWEYYLEENGEGFLGNFDAMIATLKWGGVALIVVALILYLVSRAVEPKKD